VTAKRKYLNNADLMAEIHASKLSFCSYVDTSHGAYDAFVTRPTDITPALIDEVRIKKARPYGGPKMDPESIAPDSIVFRVHTYGHIPFRPNPKDTKGRKVDGDHERTNFHPFSHYVLTGDGPREVCRSHWVGGLDNGHFSASHGRITPKLGRMLMALATNYAAKPNWAGYSYVDEMQATALVSLSRAILQFDESKGSNPFAYATTIVNNAFLKVLKDEKKATTIRDDLLEHAGAKPSFTRQHANADFGRA
jgi:hypothetical protein